MSQAPEKSRSVLCYLMPECRLLKPWQICVSDSLIDKLRPIASIDDQVVHVQI